MGFVRTKPVLVSLFVSLVNVAHQADFSRRKQFKLSKVIHLCMRCSCRQGRQVPLIVKVEKASSRREANQLRSSAIVIRPLSALPDSQSEITYLVATIWNSQQHVKPFPGYDCRWPTARLILDVQKKSSHHFLPAD